MADTPATAGLDSIKIPQWLKTIFTRGTFTSVVAVIGALATGNIAALMSHGIAAQSPQNFAILGGTGLATLLAALSSIFSVTKTATKATTGVTTEARRALSLLAEYSLLDPVAMGLVQRLATQLEHPPTDDQRAAFVTTRSVDEITAELEARLRQDAVQLITRAPSVKSTGAKP